MKVLTKRDLVVLDVARAGYARSQKICRNNGYEKEELHGITIERYRVASDKMTVSAFVKLRVENHTEEEVVFLTLVEGRWTPQAVEYYGSMLRIDLSVENGQIVFGKETTNF